MICAFCKHSVTAEESWISADDPNVRWCSDERQCITNWYEYLKVTVEVVGEKVA